MKHRSLCPALLTVLLPAALAGQRPDPVRAYVDAHQPQVIAELVRFLAIPNVRTTAPTSAATPRRW
jgi:hypothetical protein